MSNPPADLSGAMKQYNRSADKEAVQLAEEERLEVVKLFPLPAPEGLVSLAL